MLKNAITKQKNINNDAIYLHSLLGKFSHTWHKRSRVRNDEMPYPFAYELEKPDFIESLIPLYHCQSYHRLERHIKNELLSYAWLAYNAKTIAIESKIIAPVCYEIIDGHIEGSDDNQVKQVISETLVDESYHILICHYAMTLTEKARNITRHIFPEFDLVKKIIELKKQYSEKWQHTLIQLAVAVVSEIFISDYLQHLSINMEVVTLNRETVKSHRMDEVAHGSIFSGLIKQIYKKLSKQQQAFFSLILPHPVYYFASKELAVWHRILRNVCPESTEVIMDEAIQKEWYDLSHLDYRQLIELAEEMGISHFADQLACCKAIPLQQKSQKSHI